MSKPQQREESIRLRKQGKSYSEIKSVLGVAKSTLSTWLKEYPLSIKKIRELRDWNQKRIEHYIATRRITRERLLKNIYTQEKRSIFPLSKRELLLAGLFLYWGEGGKTQTASLSVSNTDPAVIKFFIVWFKKYNIPKEKLSIKLHLYKDMNIEKEVHFWSNLLKIPIQQFKRPYIKKSDRQALTYKGFGHGTCNLLLNDAKLSKRVLMGLQAIRDHYLDYSNISGPVA